MRTRHKHANRQTESENKKENKLPMSIDRNQKHTTRASMNGRSPTKNRAPKHSENYDIPPFGHNRSGVRRSYTTYLVQLSHCPVGTLRF